MKCLVWAEHDAGRIVDTTLSAISAAERMGDVSLLVTGHEVTAIAEAARRIAGIHKVYVSDAACLHENLAENVAPVAVFLMSNHDVFVAASTSNGKNIAPRVAALLDVMQITDVLSASPDRTFTRAIYAGNAIATVRSRDAKVVVTVRAAAFEPVARRGGSAAVDFVLPPGASTGAEVINKEIGGLERPCLTSARIIVSGGRGLGSAQNFQTLLAPLADKLGASIGASRAAVDAGWLPNHLQIGQTGRIVAPEVYVAIGISGAIQHLAGMKNAKTIIAINSDPDAPIFEYADFGLVADIFEAVPKLTAKL